MIIQVILIVSNFIQVKSRWAYKTKMGFFSTRNIYNDLVNIQQGLIDNNNSGHRNMMSYFIWTYEHDTQGPASIEHKKMYR
jgi:hypothetical protein